MIFFNIVRKKYLYGAFKIIFSPETFSTSLGHTGDNLERRFRHRLGGRGLMNMFVYLTKRRNNPFSATRRHKRHQHTVKLKGLGRNSSY